MAIPILPLERALAPSCDLKGSSNGLPERPFPLSPLCLLLGFLTSCGRCTYAGASFLTLAIRRFRFSDASNKPIHSCCAIGKQVVGGSSDVILVWESNKPTKALKIQDAPDGEVTQVICISGGRSIWQGRSLRQGRSPRRGGSPQAREVTQARQVPKARGVTPGKGGHSGKGGHPSQGRNP